jgi:hypothetical protein
MEFSLFFVDIIKMQDFLNTEQERVPLHKRTSTYTECLQLKSLILSNRISTMKCLNFGGVLKYENGVFLRISTMKCLNFGGVLK